MRTRDLMPALLLLAAPLAAQELPTAPPAPAPVAPLQTPQEQTVVLPNGLRLVVLERHRQPVVSLTMALPAGTGFDPPGKEGTADLFSGMLTRGAGARTRAQVQAAMERIGGSFGAQADPDFLTVEADVVGNHASLAFELIADALLRPALDSTELERLRQSILTRVSAGLQDPASLGARIFLLAAYRDYPYARRPTPASVRAISRADLVAWRRARIRPAGALLVVAGDITFAEARRLTLAAFGQWKGTRPAPLPVPTAASPASNILLIHRGGDEAAHILIGGRTFAAGDTGYYAAAVLNRLLGEGRSARLPRLLGDRHGWTLDAGSSFPRTLRLGLFQATATVPAEDADSAVRTIRAALDQLRRDTVSTDELDRARQAVSGEFALGLQTTGELVTAAQETRLLGLPAGYLRDFRKRVLGVSAAAIRAVARRVFAPEGLVTVVVGDASRLYEPLSALGPTQIFAQDGRPLTPKDVEPVTAAFAPDPARLVPRLDSLVIVAGNRAVGLQVTSIARAGDTIVYTDRTEVGTRLTQETRVTLDSAGHLQHLEQTGKVRDQDTRITLDYGAGRVRGSGHVFGPDGPVDFSVDTTVSAGIVDDNAIQALLPGLNWDLNRRWTFPVFASGEHRERTMTLTVRNIEQVQVPAGRFEVYRADLEGGRQRISFYVTTAAPHRLVRVRLSGSPIEFLALNP